MNRPAPCDEAPGATTPGVALLAGIALLAALPGALSAQTAEDVNARYGTDFNLKPQGSSLCELTPASFPSYANAYRLSNNIMLYVEECKLDPGPYLGELGIAFSDVTRARGAAYMQFRTCYGNQGIPSDLPRLLFDKSVRECNPESFRQALRDVTGEIRKLQQVDRRFLPKR